MLQAPISEWDAAGSLTAGTHLGFLSSLLLLRLGRWCVMARVPGPPPPTWEAQMELLAPGRCTHWMTGQWVEGHCLSVFL